MERNITLDYFKIVLSILVITIHFRILPVSSIDVFYKYIISEGIARIAVPCFFILNGYFINIQSKTSIKKSLKRILIFYLVWGLFYLPNYNTENTKSLIVTLFTGYKHLWYLVSLIEAIVVFYLLKKFITNNTILLCITLILFVAGYIFQLNTPESIFSTFKFRNFLFVGLPFIISGYLIREKYLSVNKANNIKILIVTSIIFLLEIYLRYRYALNIRDIYISLIIFCPALVLFILNISTYSTTKDINNISNLSSAIYFIHMFIISVACTLYKNDLYLLPFIILSTILFSFLIIYANKSLKIFL